jgi:hypothetical protein
MTTTTKIITAKPKWSAPVARRTTLGDKFVVWTLGETGYGVRFAALCGGARIPPPLFAVSFADPWSITYRVVSRHRTKRAAMDVAEKLAKERSPECQRPQKRNAKQPARSR